LTAHSEDSFT